MVNKKKNKRKTLVSVEKSGKNIEHILMQNSVEMQKIMTKLIERFENLSNKISELLELFEDSAKILVKKEIETGKIDHLNEELLEKINKLMDQNKVIARGLSLIHEKKSPELKPQSRQEDNEKLLIRKNINRPEKSIIRKEQNEKEDEDKPVFEIPD